MKIVDSWLRELVELPADPGEVAEAMTGLGMQVEDIAHIGGDVPGIITARVVRTEQHPDAAKVQRVYVDAGDGSERHVWCGAFNMSPGDVVPLATLGTTMPDGRRIERRGILGIESEGMLCSARELGLGDDHSGIVLLPPDVPLGQPVMAAQGITPDVVYDADLTRNRPDCWGLLGIARDLAAKFGSAFTPPATEIALHGERREAPVTIVAGDRCGRFTTVVISGITVTDSDPTVVRRLAAAGMRAINNVVDASNLVMLELGQPTHAYDLDTLGGGGIRVRLARHGETMVTLDGVERTLTAEDLLICDATDVPIGIAGIMGGLDTEITEATTTVAFEAAWFEPEGIAASVVRLGVRSEASARFERGVDPYGIERAQARFVDLLRRSCPDLVVHPGAVDARGECLPPAERRQAVRVAQVNRILGTKLDTAGIAAVLDPIGYNATPAEAGVLDVVLPSWRPDSTSEIDVIEEVARHHGYEKLGKTLPRSTVHGRLSAVQIRRRLLRDVLYGLGISEAMPNPFLAPGDLAAAGLDDVALRIANPLVAEESVLRTSLRPGLLQTVAYNESHRRTGAALFEIGHVYPPSGEQLPAEYESLGVILAGAEAPAAVAVWREISATLGFGARLDQGRVPPGMHPGRSASLTLGPVVVGIVGEIHPAAAEAFGVDERVAWLELDLGRVLGHTPTVAQAKPVSRFPSSDIDLAFNLADDVPAERLDKALRQAAGKLLAEASLFDVYRGRGVPEGARSLAFHLRLQATDRTLTDTEIAAVRSRCIDAAAKLGATLRG